MISEETNTSSKLETSVIDEDSSVHSPQESTVILSSPIVETLSSPSRSLSTPPLSSCAETQKRTQEKRQEKRKLSREKIDSLYSKRGGTKKSGIDDAVQAIRELTQQEASLQPEPDSFELFGFFVASRLRGMNPEERQHREMLIFKVLSDPFN